MKEIRTLCKLVEDLCPSSYHVLEDSHAQHHVFVSSVNLQQLLRLQTTKLIFQTHRTELVL